MFKSDTGFSWELNSPFCHLENCRRCVCSSVCLNVTIHRVIMTAVTSCHSAVQSGDENNFQKFKGNHGGTGTADPEESMYWWRPDSETKCLHCTFVTTKHHKKEFDLEFLECRFNYYQCRLMWLKCFIYYKNESFCITPVSVVWIVMDFGPGSW